jgi:hypothetical protein
MSESLYLYFIQGKDAEKKLKVENAIDGPWIPSSNRVKGQRDLEDEH